MRKPKAAFKRGETVILRRWGLETTETGVIEAVYASETALPNGDTFTNFRYVIAMANGRGAFGASKRFCFEREIRAAVLTPERKAA